MTSTVKFFALEHHPRASNVDGSHHSQIFGTRERANLAAQLHIPHRIFTVVFVVGFCPIDDVEPLRIGGQIDHCEVEARAINWCIKRCVNIHIELGNVVFVKRFAL